MSQQDPIYNVPSVQRTRYCIEMKDGSKYYCSSIAARNSKLADLAYQGKFDSILRQYETTFEQLQRKNPL